MLSLSMRRLSHLRLRRHISMHGCPKAVPQFRMEQCLLSSGIFKTSVITQRMFSFADWYSQTLGWTARVRVDGTTYSVLGEPDLGMIPANQTSVTFTATQTIFNHQAGPVAITVNFISPINVSSPTFRYLLDNLRSVERSHQISFTSPFLSRIYLSMCPQSMQLLMRYSCTQI